MALNATGVPTGAIEIDLFPILLQTIVAIVVSVGGGTYLGYRLSERSRTIQEKNEVKKMKDLLKNDFERINNISISRIVTMLGFIENAKNDDFIDDLLTSIEKVSQYALDNIGFFDFVYWQILSDSGHMIKLDKKEIQQIYSLHFLISGTTSRLEQYNQEDVNDLKQIIMSDASPSDKKTEFKGRLKTSTYTILGEYQIVYEQIQKMDIPWIETNQLSLDDKEKLDNEINQFRQEISSRLRNVQQN